MSVTNLNLRLGAVEIFDSVKTRANGQINDISTRKAEACASRETRVVNDRAEFKRVESNLNSAHRFGLHLELPQNRVSPPSLRYVFFEFTGANYIKHF
jgi:hypothetical protein